MTFSFNKRSSLRSSEVIDYKNVDLLRRFITVQGKVYFNF